MDSSEQREPARVTGLIRQREKGYVALRLRAVGGEFTADQVRAIASVAERYGKGRLHLTMRQGIEVHHVPRSKSRGAVEELAAAGLTMGADGPRVRIITACPGRATCRWGIIDTQELAGELDRLFFAREAPYKFKIGVTGCPNNCAGATGNDVGVMGAVVPAWDGAACNDCGACLEVCPHSAIVRTDGTYAIDTERCSQCGRCTVSCPQGAWTVERRGVVLWIGGTMGKKPRIGTCLDRLIESREELLDQVERAFAWYCRNGRPKERFGHTIERVGLRSVLDEVRTSERS